MTLKELLATRRQVASLDRDAWLEAVRLLIADIKAWMTEYDQLDVQEWTVLLVDGADKYNGPALTISFVDAQVTIQPVGRERRIEAVCGAKVASIDYAGESGWTFRFEGDATSKPLTKEAFADEVVQRLLT